MLKTLEATLDESGHLHFSEPVDLRRKMKVLVTLLEPDNKVGIPSSTPSLRSFYGVLKDSPAFTGDPTMIQRSMRDE